MADRLGEAGAQPARQPHYAPIFVAASLTGIFTQRHVFHDPSNVVTARFYGGRPDTLWDGLNVELSNELTLIRRFGCSEFSGTTYPQPPTCGFSFELDDGSIQLLIDTPSFVYLDNQDGTKTTIFTKKAGAGQGFFVPSGNTLYYGDGVDTLKYTPGNPNGIVWNWAIAPPTAPPTISTVETGNFAVQWVANTFFSTMGLLVDSNNNIQFLVSTQQNGNTTELGKTGAGNPIWSNATGGTTADNTVTWRCKGQLGLWVPGTTWNVFSPIYDPDSNGIYVAFFGGTSGSVRPKFVPTFNTHTTDSGGVEWQYIGPPQLWFPTTLYNSFWEFPNEMVCEPILPTLANLSTVTQPIFVQTANDATVGHTNNPGTSGSGYSPPWAISPGLQTADNELLWTCLGSKNWAPTASYAGWAPGSSSFSAIVDGNGNFQVCITTGTSQNNTPYNGWQKSHSFVTNSIIAVQNSASATGWTAFKNNGATGTSGSSEPTWNFTLSSTTTDAGVTWTSLGPTTAGTPVWGQKYGATMADGSAAWVNCGTASTSTWVTNTQWFLPGSGFAPPQPSAPYGGASVIGSAFVQFTTASGLSGGSAPSWATTVGNTTADGSGSLVWTCEAPYNSSTFSLVWFKGFYYAFSFKSRLANDFWNTNTPPGHAAPLGTPTGALTGGISTSSPSASVTGSNVGAVNTITGLGSTDPQVDTIEIYRSADGGGVGNMFWLTDIPNPQPVGGNAQPWSFDDYLPSAPIGIFPGLNNLIPAPIDDENDPPPAGFRPLCSKLHFARIFGAVGNTVFFSGGPDVLTGNPNEAFNPVDEFPFQSTVTTLIHTPAGLICPTTTDFECIFGGPSTGSFFDTTVLPGTGMFSPNAWDLHGGEIYFLSTDSQFWIFNPQTQLARLGFPVGKQLAAYDSATAYVTIHESGTDNAIYVGDGASGWFRLNPHQVGADIAGRERAGVVAKGRHYRRLPNAAIARDCSGRKAVAHRRHRRESAHPEARHDALL